MTTDFGDWARTITDPTDFPTFAPAALPPADYDNRTLDAVQKIIHSRIATTKWAADAKLLNLTWAQIERELRGNK